MFTQGQAYKPNDLNGKRRPKKEMNENVVVFYRKQMKMFKKRTHYIDTDTILTMS